MSLTLVTFFRQEKSTWDSIFQARKIYLGQKGTEQEIFVIPISKGSQHVKLIIEAMVMPLNVNVNDNDHSNGGSFQLYLALLEENRDCRSWETFHVEHSLICPQKRKEKRSTVQWAQTFIFGQRRTTLQKQIISCINIL